MLSKTNNNNKPDNEKTPFQIPLIPGIYDKLKELFTNVGNDISYEYQYVNHILSPVKVFSTSVDNDYIRGIIEQNYYSMHKIYLNTIKKNIKRLPSRTTSYSLNSISLYQSDGPGSLESSGSTAGSGLVSTTGASAGSDFASVSGSALSVFVSITEDSVSIPEYSCG